MRGQDLAERCLQNPEELVHHLRLRPKEALQILHPFEVRNDHTTRVAQDVGNNKYLWPLRENGICRGRCRTVRGFRKDAALDLTRIRFSDLSLQGGGHEDVAWY